MKKVELGFTNEKFISGNKFIVNKKYTGFNHKIDYEILEVFPFVPKLISDDEKSQTWELIKGSSAFNLLNSDLINIALILKEIHHSKLKLPRWNLRKRVNEYLNIMRDKDINNYVVSNVYREMFNIMKEMKTTSVPSHNDVWIQNFIKDEKDKLWLIDWEYATMNDKHFDLAYFIMSQGLNEKDETLFLETYGKIDTMILMKYKRFVTYLTIIWAYAQEKMPFNVDSLTDYLDKRIR